MQFEAQRRTFDLVDATAILKARVVASIEAKRALLSDAKAHATFEAIVTLVIAAYKSGGRLYIAGNGGSAADAQHLAAEFVSKLARDRAPLAAEALTVDTSVLTAIGGLIASESDYCLLAPANVTSTIQELHIVFSHALCECVENAMFPLPAPGA